MRLKLPFWASVLTFFGVCILSTLGVWQVQRMQWKQEILLQLDSEYAKDAAKTPLDRKDVYAQVTSQNPYVFSRGFLNGRFLHEKSILVAPKTYQGDVGALLFTPFVIDHQGGVIWVNRGWIPHTDYKMNLGKVFEKYRIEQPGGVVKVMGMVRLASERNMYTPKNKPEGGFWYFPDITEISAYTQLDDVSAHIFVLEGGDGLRASYPVMDAARLTMSNHHAQYAVFWFSMAFVLLCVYGMRFLRRIQNVDELKVF